MRNKNPECTQKDQYSRLPARRHEGRRIASVTQGTTAKRAALLKNTKFAAIKETHKFLPEVIENLGRGHVVLDWNRRYQRTQGRRSFSERKYTNVNTKTKRQYIAYGTFTTVMNPMTGGEPQFFSRRL